MASAKTNRMNRLVYILEHASSWVSSSALAKMLNTSERTVRNYIAEINRDETHAVESSKNGYRIRRQRPNALDSSETTSPSEASTAAHNPASDPHAPRNKDPVEVRRNYVLSRLVNAHGSISLFDLADELFISESTLSNAVMPGVRKLLSQFDISVEVHDFMARLDGHERDKRRLLGHIATQGTNGYFTSTSTLQELFPDYRVNDILNRLVEICQKSSLILNNYALNNLLVHILVIIIRLRTNNELGERDGTIDLESLVGQLSQRDGILRCADEISTYFKEEFGCAIPNADYRQIVLLITLSIEHYAYDELNLERLSHLIEQPFVNMVDRLAGDTVARYGIARFDESFLLQLTLHMYNVYQRAVYHVRYPNPLAYQIKSDHAPVYDMAVYFAHRFATETDIELDENEIGFIAFHIGAYLERNATPSDAVTCIVIVEQYHDFARRLVGDLEKALADEVDIIGVMNCDSYLANHPQSDVVITTIDVPVRHALKVLIGPILTKQNLRKVQDKLANLLEQRRREHAYRFLRNMFVPELFARNLSLDGDEDAYIDYLGTLAVEHGYADGRFVTDAHLREHVSSTAFTDCLAVPHSIDSYAIRSFIAVAHNDRGIPWGRHNVHFVLLIGIAENEMGYFRDALDIIIDLFSSVDSTMRLMQTDSFDEFVGAFLE